MKDEVRGQLESLFARDKQKAEVAAQEKRERVAQAELNDAEFLRIRDAMIVPAMREMAEFISTQGWDSEISIEEWQAGSHGQASPAKVAMTLFREASLPTISGMITRMCGRFIPEVLQASGFRQVRSCLGAEGVQVQVRARCCRKSRRKWCRATSWMCCRASSKVCPEHSGWLKSCCRV
ncbi:hypothetical protein ACFSLT_28845 [Novosphingobium resinovorum]